MSSDIGRQPTSMRRAASRQAPQGYERRSRVTALVGRVAVAGGLGLAVVIGVASPCNAPSSAQAAPQARPAPAPETRPAVRAADHLGSSPDSGRRPRASDEPSRSAKAAAPAAASQAARGQTRTQTRPAQRVAELRSSRGASRGSVRAAKPAAKTAAKALSPKATLARTPTARSTRTTRVAALAFPDLSHFTWMGPVSGTRQTSGFGQRWGRLHAGLDFAGPVGTPLRSMSSGVVKFAGAQGGYGKKVELLMWDGSLVNYGHMSSIAVKTGQKVTPGQIVGRLGNTGHSTGPHLHIEVRPGGGDPIDPWPWLVARGVLPPDMPRK